MNDEMAPEKDGPSRVFTRNNNRLDTAIELLDEAAQKLRESKASLL